MRYTNSFLNIAFPKKSSDEKIIALKKIVNDNCRLLGGAQFFFTNSIITHNAIEKDKPIMAMANIL